MRAFHRLVAILLVVSVMFLLAGLIENVVDGGPRAITVTSLWGLVNVLFTAGLLMWLKRKARR